MHLFMHLFCYCLHCLYSLAVHRGFPFPNSRPGADGRKKQALVYRRSKAEAATLMALPLTAFKMLCSPKKTASFLQIPRPIDKASRVNPNAASIDLWGPIWPVQLLVLTALWAIPEWDLYNRVAIAYMGLGTRLMTRQGNS